MNRSHRWLLRMNLLAVAATLYVCALTSFDAIIAGYNVTHSPDAGGKGVVLDIPYLASLGPQALPAIDRGRIPPFRSVSLRVSRPAAGGTSQRHGILANLELPRLAPAALSQHPSVIISAELI